VNPAGTVKLSVTLAPGVNPAMLKVNQPKGVEMPLGAAAGVATICALPMVPVLASSITVPSSVAKLQLAPTQVGLMVAAWWLVPHADMISAALDTMRAKQRLRVSWRRSVAFGSRCIQLALETPIIPYSRHSQ
jgi:hypothetical protein